MKNTKLFRKISNRLTIALVALVIIISTGAFYANSTDDIVTAPLAAFAAGIMGGFVGLQRRLKSLSEDD